MSTAQNEVRVGLIGPQKAGKTNLFETVEESLDRGRHGFSITAKPKMRRSAPPTPIEGLSSAAIIAQVLAKRPKRAFNEEARRALQGGVEATASDGLVHRPFQLTYHDLPRTAPHELSLTITDAAGELSWGDDPVSASVRDLLYEELAGCDGFVTVVPFSDACTPQFLERLDGWLDALSKVDTRTGERKERGRTRRWVIALTRYDTLFTDFGSAALGIASDQSVATDIICRLVNSVEYGLSYEDNISEFDTARGGPFDISLVPTSSFGFVPGFGCVNIDPNDQQALDSIRDRRSPQSFDPKLPGFKNQRLFPFLTADPFVFAATGLDNHYVVPIKDALNGTSYEERRTERRARMAASSHAGMAASSQREPEEDIRPSRSDPPNPEPKLRDWLSRHMRRFSLDL